MSPPCTHLQDPDIALAELCRVLQPGGTLTVIEGDHGSTLFHPDDLAARSVIRCQVELQRLAGGDAEIGRRLRPLLVSAGLCDVHIEPRLIYADEGSPTLMSGFVRDTFTSMMAGVGKEAIRAGLMEAEAFEAGIQALLRTTEQGGVFCYTFFKARAFKAAARLLA